MLQSEPAIIPFHHTDLSGRRVLVLAPHPDDETIGCGGGIARHTLAGDPVQVVFLTDGSQGDMGGRYERADYIRLRQSEAKAACRHLGVSDYAFWPYTDRRLGASNGVVERLTSLMTTYLPELVYVPSPLEFHPDHRAASLLFHAAFRKVSLDSRVVFYEIGQPVPVNTLVDITPVLDRKTRAMAAYASQLDERPYGEISLALNRFRSLTLTPEVTHAEGMCRFPAGQVREAANLFSLFSPDPSLLGFARPLPEDALSPVPPMKHFRTPSASGTVPARCRARIGRVARRIVRQVFPRPRSRP